jgi:CBS domain-containing protein
MLASEILERKGSEVATVAPDDSVADALRVLEQHGVGALVVSADGTTVAGILSERDIVRRLAQEGAEALSQDVAQLMIAEVFTCDRSAHVDELMNLMTERRFRHVPVVEDDSLVGIISIGDVVKCRVDELETKAEQLVDYIRTGR